MRGREARVDYWLCNRRSRGRTCNGCSARAVGVRGRSPWIPVTIRGVRSTALLLAATVVAGCSGGAAQKQADVCAAAWQGGITAAQETATALNDAEPLLEQRKKDAEKAAVAIEKRLAALTIRREEAVVSYPDKVKGRVVSAKMRVGSIQALREESGKPLAKVRFDVEIQGEYKRFVKMLAALYEQPKAFFLEKVEVNIADERKGWAIVKVQFHVNMLTASAPPLPADPGLPAAFTSALAWVPAAECASHPAPAEMAAGRAALQEKEAVARAVRSVEVFEEAVKARTAIADDLIRRRDDDRAMWTSHSDEIVEKAKTSVTGVAQLRFNEKGEPDWRM